MDCFSEACREAVKVASWDRNTSVRCATAFCAAVCGRPSAGSGGRMARGAAVVVVAVGEEGDESEFPSPTAAVPVPLPISAPAKPSGAIDGERPPPPPESEADRPNCCCIIAAALDKRLVLPPWKCERRWLPFAPPPNGNEPALWLRASCCGIDAIECDCDSDGDGCANEPVFRAKGTDGERCGAGDNADDESGLRACDVDEKNGAEAETEAEDGRRS